MMTEPVFRWLRRRFPFLVMGGLDLSPLVVLFGIYFLQLYLVPVLTELGYRLK
jgi:YggT family protein